jgi:hypothetical protein
MGMPNIVTTKVEGDYIQKALLNPKDRDKIINLVTQASLEPIAKQNATKLEGLEKLRTIGVAKEALDKQKKDYPKVPINGMATLVQNINPYEFGRVYASLVKSMEGEPVATILRKTTESIVADTQASAEKKKPSLDYVSDVVSSVGTSKDRLALSIGLAPKDLGDVSKVKAFKDNKKNNTADTSRVQLLSDMYNTIKSGKTTGVFTKLTGADYNSLEAFADDPTFYLVLSSALKRQAILGDEDNLDFTNQKNIAAIQSALNTATLYYVEPLVKNIITNKGQK